MAFGGNKVTANEPQRYNPNEEATHPEQKNDFPSQEPGRIIPAARESRKITV